MYKFINIFKEEKNQNQRKYVTSCFCRHVVHELFLLTDWWLLLRHMSAVFEFSSILERCLIIFIVRLWKTSLAYYFDSRVFILQVRMFQWNPEQEKLLPTLHVLTISFLAYKHKQRCVCHRGLPWQISNPGSGCFTAGPQGLLHASAEGVRVYFNHDMMAS